jgi:hypothetical protein
MHEKKMFMQVMQFFQMLNIKILIKLMIIIFSTCCLYTKNIAVHFLLTYTRIWSFNKCAILFEHIIQIQNILHVPWQPKLHTMMSNICPYVINLGTIHKLRWFPFKVTFHWVMWKNGKIHQKSWLPYFVVYHVYENNIKTIDMFVTFIKIYFKKTMNK